MAEFATGLTAGASAAMEALSQHTPANNGNKMAGAARDFEALLLTQILRSAHGADSWLGSGDDDAGEAAIGLGEEQLARTMAASGGLGLSKLIESGLSNQQARTNSRQALPSVGDAE